MPKIAVVTDSTAYIPPDLVEKHKIHVIPQTLIWGSETLRDGIDIQPDEFYIRLSKAKVMPSTSQATPAAFNEAYKKLLDEGHEVLSVLVSERLSGTISSATQAKSNFPGAPIEIFDSNTTAMAMGFLALEAARAAEAGATMHECLDLLARARENTGVFVYVDTLEFLHRGGRIGGGTRFLGTALNIKPILELRDGRLESIDKVRTRTKALARVIELTEGKIGSRRPVHLAVVHANAIEEARLALDQLKARFELKEAVISPVSPVVGTHVGPGTVGIAFLAGI